MRARGPVLARRATTSILSAGVCLLAFAATACATVRPATPGTFSSVLGQAQPGDVVELAAGNYGRFNGAQKSGPVVIRSAVPGAAVMSPSFSSASNLRLEGLTIPELTISGSTHNVAIAGSTFTGGAVVRTDGMSNANILFDGNSHPNINVCGNCYEGRLEVTGSGSSPAGVTVQHSRFGPGGDADGMQIGANGVRVLNNEFVGIHQVDEVHTDSLQLYGQRNTVIQGNYFHDFDVAIMAPDGGTNEVIADNVFVSNGEYKPAIQLGSQHGTVFVHNTVQNIDMHMDRKTENPGNPSRDGVIKDNIFINGTAGGYTTDPSYCSNCTITNNMFSSSRSAEGTAALVGVPAFAGGAAPTSWTGFLLANGSPGKGRATDGTDMGIRAAASGGTPGGTPPASPKHATARRAKLSLDRHITFDRLKRGLRVKVTVHKRTKLTFDLRRKGARKPLVRKVRVMRHGTKWFVLKPAAARLGARHPMKLVLRVSAKPRGGKKFTLKRIVHVRLHH